MYIINTNFISTVLNKKLISTHFEVKLVVGEWGEFYTHRRCCRQHCHSHGLSVFPAPSRLWDFKETCRMPVRGCMPLLQSEKVLHRTQSLSINRKSRGEAMTTRLYWDFLWDGEKVIGLFHWDDDLIGQFQCVVCIWQLYLKNTNFISTVLNKKLVSTHFGPKLMVSEIGEFYTHTGYLVFKSFSSRVLFFLLFIRS